MLELLIRGVLAELLVIPGQVLDPSPPFAGFLCQC